MFHASAWYFFYNVASFIKRKFNHSNKSVQLALKNVPLVKEKIPTIN